MKRVLTATCFAAAFAVGLAAQTTGTSGSTAQDPQAGGGQRGGGPRTVTGCLRAGDTAGTYMLTDVTMQGGGRRGGDATTTAAGAAGGTTAGAAGTTAGGTGTAGATGTTAATGMQSGRAMAPQSIMLTADSTVDLKAHVGHKIEVTGTMMGGRGRGGDTTGSTGTATGTTTGGTTAGATGTTATGGTATATGTTTGAGQGMGRGGPRSMTVTSVRMVSESCN